MGGYSAVLYEHSNYKGTSSIHADDVPNLSDDPIGNDHVSSLIVFR
jgi:hypothetical protein